MPTPIPRITVPVHAANLAGVLNWLIGQINNALAEIPEPPEPPFGYGSQPKPRPAPITPASEPPPATAPGRSSSAARSSSG